PLGGAGGRGPRRGEPQATALSQSAELERKADRALASEQAPGPTALAPAPELGVVERADDPARGGHLSGGTQVTVEDQPVSLALPCRKVDGLVDRARTSVAEQLRVSPQLPRRPGRGETAGGGGESERPSDERPQRSARGEREGEHAAEEQPGETPERGHRRRNHRNVLLPRGSAHREQGPRRPEAQRGSEESGQIEAGQLGHGAQRRNPRATRSRRGPREICPEAEKRTDACRELFSLRRAS